MTKAEFGRRMNTSRQNVNTMLRKADWQVESLLQASRILKKNFFKAFVNDSFISQLDFDLESVKLTGIGFTIELNELKDIRAFLDWWGTYLSSK